MNQKAIALNRSVDPGQVLAVARSVVEGRKYLWEPTGPDSAKAHQGGKLIEKKASASKLLLGLRLENGELVLSQETHGGVGYVVNMGPLVGLQVAGEFRKMRKKITQALNEAGLAAV